MHILPFKKNCLNIFLYGLESYKVYLDFFRSFFHFDIIHNWIFFSWSLELISIYILSLHITKKHAFVFPLSKPHVAIDSNFEFRFLLKTFFCYNQYLFRFNNIFFWFLSLIFLLYKQYFKMFIKYWVYTK